jgi:membrane protease YdiL (CAAX protease family)
VSPSWRATIASRLRTRWAAGLEILLVLALTIGHRVGRVIPIDETLPILVLGWVSLWLRGTGWKGVGFQGPATWLRAIVLGIGTGVLLQVLSVFVAEPLIAHLTGQVADVSEFRPLVGNLRLLLVYLVVVWSWAAFGEELAYRGYVLNRAAELGGRTPLAWVASLLFVMYFVSGRNLWASIIAHGAGNTIALGVVFLGFL